MIKQRGSTVVNDQDTDPVLSKIDPDKRQFIGKLIKRTAFVAPLVASFAMDSISANATGLNSNHTLG